MRAAVPHAVAVVSARRPPASSLGAGGVLPESASKTCESSQMIGHEPAEARDQVEAVPLVQRLPIHDGEVVVKSYNEASGIRRPRVEAVAQGKEPKALD